jgi:hypothetical protein
MMSGKMILAGEDILPIMAKLWKIYKKPEILYVVRKRKKQKWTFYMNIKNCWAWL